MVRSSSSAAGAMWATGKMVHEALTGTLHTAVSEVESSGGQREGCAI